MNIFHVINLRSIHLIRNPLRCFPCFLHSRTLSRHKEKPTNWNATHAFVRSNPVLYLLEQCKSFSQLKQIQSQMTITGLILDGVALSRLIAFCAISESKNLDHCTKLLFNARNPNAFSWNVAIRGFLECQMMRDAVDLYKQMLRNGGCRPDNFTYPLLFKACASLGFGFLGSEIFCHVLKLGFDLDMYVHNALIHVFVSCGKLELACKVFDEGCVRNLVSWNSLINGYVRNGCPREAIRLYQNMNLERVKPDDVTMIGVVSSSAQLEDLNLGREFHQYISESGLVLTVPLANALMDMYVKCGELKAAEEMFDSMVHKTVASCTTMIVGYAKFGFLDKARKILHGLPEKDVVPWNAIIGGCIRAKRSEEALTLFHEMQATDIEPDAVTMVHCLSACSQIGALEVGIRIHRFIEKQQFNLNVVLGTALVDMYAKCGEVAKALQVFHEMPVRNSLTYTAIIGGLALHGNATHAISYFSKMTDSGLVPDEITFLGVLSACCHGGLVDEGRQYFSQMKSKFRLSPQLKHYSCLVDLLGRAGLLEEAEQLIRSMPMEADVVVWGAFFFACRMHGDVSMGQRAAMKLLELDPSDGGNYVLLCNMYRNASMWEEAEKVRKMMTEQGVEKTPGCSSIEVRGILNEFTVRDRSHLESEHIYDCLVQLTRQLEFVEHITDVPTNAGELLLGF